MPKSTAAVFAISCPLYQLPTLGSLYGLSMTIR
jgi:hypothetical protein